MRLFQQDGGADSLYVLCGPQVRSTQKLPGHLARELFSHSAEERARSTRQGRGRPVFCRFPSPSGQKNSCGVNAHKNGALRQIPAALCIRPTGRTGSPYRRRRHTVCFGASAQQKSALRRPNRLSASASLLFAGCPLYSTTPRSLQRRTGGLLLDRSFQYALPLAFLRYLSLIHI